MTKFIYDWKYNKEELDSFLSKFKIEIHNDNINIMFENIILSELKNDKTYILHNNSFKHTLISNLTLSNFNIKNILFEYKDNSFEYKIIGDDFNDEYYKYICISDSIDGKLALQLNLGLINKNTKNILIIDNNDLKTSIRWKQGKSTLNEKIESSKLFLINEKSIYENIYYKITQMKNNFISYKEFILNMVELDDKCNIKLGHRQRILAINKKIRTLPLSLNNETLKALKTPELYIESELNFDIPVDVLFIQYLDSFKNQNSSFINRESNRILDIVNVINTKKICNNLFDTKLIEEIINEENNPYDEFIKITDNNDKIFLEKTNRSFDDFYKKNFKKLTYFLFKYTKNIETAEDVANEAFIQALQKIEMYDNKLSKIHTWLYKIAENLVRKNYKEEQKKNYYTFDDTYSEEIVYNNTSEQAMFTRKIYDTDIFIEEEKHDVIVKKAALIKNAIYNLPEKYRKVLILREIDNMQYQDISDTLNINLSTIKSQIAKGRKIISKKVEKEFKKLDKLIEIL